MCYPVVEEVNRTSSFSFLLLHEQVCTDLTHPKEFPKCKARGHSQVFQSVLLMFNHQILHIYMLIDWGPCNCFSLLNQDLLPVNKDIHPLTQWVLIFSNVHSKCAKAIFSNSVHNNVQRCKNPMKIAAMAEGVHCHYPAFHISRAVHLMQFWACSSFTQDDHQKQRHQIMMITELFRLNNLILHHCHFHG